MNVIKRTDYYFIYDRSNAIMSELTDQIVILNTYRVFKNRRFWYQTLILIKLTLGYLRSHFAVEHAIVLSSLL